MKIDNAFRIGSLNFKKIDNKYAVEFSANGQKLGNMPRKFEAITLNLAYLKLEEFLRYGFN